MNYYDELVDALTTSLEYITVATVATVAKALADVMTESEVKELVSYLAGKGKVEDLTQF